MATVSPAHSFLAPGNSLLPKKKGQLSPVNAGLFAMKSQTTNQNPKATARLRSTPSLTVLFAILCIVRLGLPLPYLHSHDSALDQLLPEATLSQHLADSHASEPAPEDDDFHWHICWPVDAESTTAKGLTNGSTGTLSSIPFGMGMPNGDMLEQSLVATLALLFDLHKSPLRRIPESQTSLARHPHQFFECARC